MAATDDLQPPIDPGEIETVSFDFGPALATGETVRTIVSSSCAVLIGTDSSASERILGSPQIVASPSTGLASGGVAMRIGTMIADTVYRLQVFVTTSAGQTLTLYTHIQCAAPDTP